MIQMDHKPKPVGTGPSEKVQQKPGPAKNETSDRTESDHYQEKFKSWFGPDQDHFFFKSRTGPD